MKLSHLIEVLNQYKKSFDEKNYDPDVVVRTDDFEERDLFDDFCVSASSNRDGMYLCLFTYDENAEIKEVTEYEEEPSEELEKEQMTKEEFNEKYKDFIEEGYSGMELVNETLIWYIDKIMKTLIKIPEFKLYTITYKFGSYYFRSNQDNSTLDDFIECGIRDTVNFINKYKNEEDLEN